MTVTLPDGRSGDLSRLDGPMLANIDGREVCLDPGTYVICNGGVHVVDPAIAQPILGD